MAEACRVQRFLARYRQNPYGVLAIQVNEFDKETITRADGSFWQLQANFCWDDAPQDKVLVLVDVDGAWAPITGSFTKSPADTFMGE